MKTDVAEKREKTKPKQKNHVFTHVREPDCSVSLHNSLHLVKRPITVAAEVKSQSPIGRQRRQPYELEIKTKYNERRRSPLFGSDSLNSPVISQIRDPTQVQ